MTGRGRPLRFFGIVLGAWIALRVYLLWPEMPAAISRQRSVVPAAPTHTRAEPVYPRPGRTRSEQPPAIRSPSLAATPVSRALRNPVQRIGPTIARLRPPVAGGAPPAPPPYVRDAGAAPSAPSRWSVSAWSIVRAGTARSSVATPQLGGSQAGARIAYALDDAGRFAVTARVSSALGTRQQEAAAGVEWHPAGLPVRLIAERRIGIANTRSGVALGAIAGISEHPLTLGFHLNGYGQAGVIARDHRNGAEGYADGAVRVARPFGPIDLGVGAWGAAQRDAARLDAGPSIGLALPVGERRVRVTLDWRQRIAGRARPRSGPALSIGTDF